MTRMTGPGCAVMCNLINTHTHTYTPGSSANNIDIFFSKVITCGGTISQVSNGSFSLPWVSNGLGFVLFFFF